MSKCILLMLIVACSREESAPTATTSSQPAATTATTRPPHSPKQSGISYDKAMVWLQSTPGFHFVIDENGVHAEGDMTRPTVGAETIEIRVDGQEWSAAAGSQGVTWRRRAGGKWTAASPPDWGNRVYQRVTLAFDPQKKEGVAQLVSSEGRSSLYRFTNANTGEVHEVWVSNSDSHVERMRIGNAVELTISNART